MLEILGVASVHHADPDDPAEMEALVETGTDGLRMAVRRTTNSRCERCWRYRQHVAAPDEGGDPLCARCELFRDEREAE